MQPNKENSITLILIAEFPIMKLIGKKEKEKFNNESELNVVPNLKAYYKFNVGSGDILYDHSGNGNHGTINGATWSTELDLNDGNNLMSFPGGSQITDADSLLSSMGDTINFIIGQGVGLFNTDDGWSGNLNDVDKYSGYWMNLDEDITFSYLLDGEPVISPPVEYNITGGNNLVSYLGKDGCAALDAVSG